MGEYIAQFIFTKIILKNGGCYKTDLRILKLYSRNSYFFFCAWPQQMVGYPDFILLCESKRFSAT